MSTNKKLIVSAQQPVSTGFLQKIPKDCRKSSNDKLQQADFDRVEKFVVAC